MRSVPAREIKRRGISAVDEPKYVVLSREQYEDLIEGDEESLVDQVRASSQFK